MNGFKEKLRQGKALIKPAPFEAVEEKREQRKEDHKKAKVKAAEVAAKTFRSKRKPPRY